jgi:ABC-type lipoprotein release transport system permease subunit
MNAAFIVLIFTMVFGLVFGKYFSIIGVASAVFLAEVINFNYQKNKFKSISNEWLK